MIPVDPAAFLRVQQRQVDQVTVDWYPGQGLKAQHVTRIATRQGVSGLHGDQVLDADPKGTVAVIARFIRQDHAGLQCDIASARQTLRPLVHAQVSPDTVTRAMVIIHPGQPQMISREHVEMRSGHAARKAGARDRDQTLEDEGVGARLFRARCPDDQRSGDVRRPVRILPAAVENDQVTFDQVAVGVRRHPVVRQCAVRARACDRIKGNLAQHSGVTPKSF